MGAEGDVCEVEFADGVVIVLEVGWVLAKELGRVSMRFDILGVCCTSSFFFRSFSDLKLAIFAPRRAFGSVVEIVEKVVGDSV